MLLHKEIERLKINMYSRLPHFQLALDHHRHRHRLHLYYQNLSMSFGNSGRDGIKVFQIKEFLASVVLFEIRLMFQKHCNVNEFGFV